MGKELLAVTPLHRAAGVRRMVVSKALHLNTA